LLDETNKLLITSQLQINPSVYALVYASLPLPALLLMNYDNKYSIDVALFANTH